MSTLKLTQARRDLILTVHRERYERNKQATMDRHDSFSQSKFKFTLDGLVSQMSNVESRQLLLDALEAMKTTGQWLSPAKVLELTTRHKEDAAMVRHSRLQAERYLRSMEKRYLKEAKRLTILLTMSDSIPTKELTKIIGSQLVKQLRLETKEKQ